MSGVLKNADLSREITALAESWLTAISAEEGSLIWIERHEVLLIREAAERLTKLEAAS